MTKPGALVGGPVPVAFSGRGTVKPSRIVPILESLRDPRTGVAEELRLLRARVLALLQQDEIKCLAVTSAVDGDGKTTIALGLAAALAREPGRRVLLIEADVRRPSISEALGLPSAAGLAEWLNGAFEQAPVRLVETGGFHLLVAGQAVLERPEDIASPLMDGLLRSARDAFDVVLLDAPPILSVADTVLLQDLVDGLLLVARSRATPRGALADAIGSLHADKLLGVVLNDHREYGRSYAARAAALYHAAGTAAAGRRADD
jgi:capsular exopolysaccharide synthesis family protein